MTLYSVEISIVTEIVVVADDYDHAYQIAAEEAKTAIDECNEWPNVHIRGEIEREGHLPTGWDGMCIPYGGDRKTRLKELLAESGNQS